MGKLSEWNNVVDNRNIEEFYFDFVMEFLIDIPIENDQQMFGVVYYL
jgi:hypothetical protein